MSSTSDRPLGETSAPTWSELLDAYARALTGVQAALDNGQWPSDGWTAPSLAVPVDEPTDGELDRYRQLSELAVAVEARLATSMQSISAELASSHRGRDAARAYGHASSIEARSRA